MSIHLHFSASVLNARSNAAQQTIYHLTKQAEEFVKLINRHIEQDSSTITDVNKNVHEFIGFAVRLNNNWLSIQRATPYSHLPDAAYGSHIQIIPDSADEKIAINIIEHKTEKEQSSHHLAEFEINDIEGLSRALSQYFYEFTPTALATHIANDVAAHSHNKQKIDSLKDEHTQVAALPDHTQQDEQTASELPTMNLLSDQLETAETVAAQQTPKLRFGRTLTA